MQGKTRLRRTAALCLITTVLFSACSESSTSDINTPSTPSITLPAPEQERLSAQISVPDSVLLFESVQASARDSYSTRFGDQLSYQWSLSVPTGSTCQLSSTTAMEVSFKPDILGSYTLILEVKNAQGLSERIEREIQVLKPVAGEKLALENTTDTTLVNTPFTFAYPFLKSTHDKQQQFALRLTDQNELVSLQVDAKATHSDGSLRHAIFSGLLPSLNADSIENAELMPVADRPNEQVSSLEELLTSGWDALIKLNVAGQAYSLSARELLMGSGVSTWLSGPLVNEWKVAGIFKDNTGIEHPHLAGNFSIRVYGQLEHIRISTVVENNWAYEDKPKNITYDASIEVGGNEVYAVINLNHLHHARWRKTFWSSGEPALHIAHDAEHLIDAGVVPNYDRSLVGNIAQSLLNYYRDFWVDEQTTIAVDDNGYFVAVGAGGNEFTYNKIGPMGIALANPFMPATGARPDIGPLPRWSSSFVLSQDVDSKRAAIGMGNQLASWPIHYRDKQTGLPVSIDDYPYASTLWNAPLTRNPDTGKLEKLTACTEVDAALCVSPYTPDVAHQPSPAYVPYLLTGDYFFLEEMQFWANFNFLKMNPFYRHLEQGLFERDMQDRGQAWSMRTLGYVSYITPDDDPFKQYFESKLQNNLNKYYEKYVLANPNSFGALNPTYSYPTASPWMDDFFTWSISSIVDLGYDNALDLLKWKAKFPVQRMGFGSAQADDYCWIFASAYHVLVAPDASSGMFSTIKQVYDGTNGQTIPYDGGFDDQGTECGSLAQANILGLSQGEMTGYSSSPTGFPSNTQIGLAAAASAGIPDSDKAWQRFMNRSVKPDYSAYPNYAIIPR